MRFFRNLFSQCLPFKKATAPAPLSQVVVVDTPAITGGAGVAARGQQPLPSTPETALRPVRTKQKKKKKSIPKSVRLAVWSKYIGEHIGVTKCPVCRTNEIGQMRFEVAHVIAEAKGGTMNIENLRPICPTCNRSMGTTNLEEFRKRFFEHQPPEAPPSRCT